jgi:hypothetical protein
VSRVALLLIGRGMHHGVWQSLVWYSYEEYRVFALKIKIIDNLSVRKMTNQEENKRKLEKMREKDKI